MVQATFYDGLNAERYTAEVVVAGARSIRVTPSVGEPVELEADELVVADEDKQKLILSRRGLPGWRLILDQPVAPELRAALPRTAHYGGWIDRVGLGKASLVLAGIAGAVLLIGHSAPLWIAPIVPPSWERNVGDAIVGDFGALRCRSPEGDAALNALVERLDPGATGPGANQIRIAALDVDMFNAAAIPGAHIVVFKGALDETNDIDALAGIIAHEIAHVRRRPFSTIWRTGPRLGAGRSRRSNSSTATPAATPAPAISPGPTTRKCPIARRSIRPPPKPC